MTKNQTPITQKLSSAQDTSHKLKKKCDIKRLDSRCMKMNDIKQSFKRINSNVRITKSKILMRKRFGDLKLGYFSDLGYRNQDLIID